MRVLALALAALVLAGCSAPPPSTAFRASAAAPAVFVGYDYAAAAPERGDGAISIEVDAATDTGQVAGTFPHAGQAWRVAFTRFAETRPFHEGGVRSGFQEHGASGNGDPNLPEFSALNAGWGQGTVEVDGAPFLDPLTGEGTFNLHYMVTDTAPRDPATLQVTKADGATPYDPATPTDGRVHNATRMVLLNVQSAAPAPPMDTNTVLSDTITGPNYNRAQTFDVNSTAARVTVSFVATNPTEAPTVGLLTFTATAPDGSESANWTYDPIAAGAAGRGNQTFELGPVQAGTHNLQVQGHGVGVTYSTQAVVDYPEPLFLHVVYTQVSLGQDRSG